MSYFHRREWLRAGVVSLGSFVVGGPLPKDVVAGTRRGIFDAHLHIPSDNGENFQWSLVTRNMPEFVAYLDKCGVRRGVISSSWSNKAQTPEDYRNGNREVAKYADRYQGRFRGSCVITPFRIEEALREIERCHTEYGFVWLGEFCNYMTGYKYDTPEWRQVMELATKLNLVVQIHTNTQEMRYLAERFPTPRLSFHTSAAAATTYSPGSRSSRGTGTRTSISRVRGSSASGFWSEPSRRSARTACCTARTSRSTNLRPSSRASETRF